MGTSRQTTVELKEEFDLINVIHFICTECGFNRKVFGNNCIGDHIPNVWNSSKVIPDEKVRREVERRLEIGQKYVFDDGVFQCPDCGEIEERYTIELDDFKAEIRCRTCNVNMVKRNIKIDQQNMTKCPVCGGTGIECKVME